MEDSERKKRLKDEREKRLKERRMLIGEILREARTEAGFKSDFAAKPPMAMKASFVRMIEAGNADLPVRKIPAYANALSSKASAGGAKFDPEALTLAYASLRSLDGSYTEHARFNWETLLKDRVRGKLLLRDELTRKVPYADTRRKSQTGSTTDAGPLRVLEGLNPIQLLLIQNIADGVGRLGSNVITDQALAGWEQANAPQIERVLAVTPCLESESSPVFEVSIRGIVESTRFKRFQYLVVANEEREFNDIWEGLKSSTVGKLRRSNKWEDRRVTTHQFEQLRSVVEDDSKLTWDALYLYELTGGPSLLIGTFRRLTSRLKTVPRVTHKAWGCPVVNEALPYRAIAEFKKAFSVAWQAQP